MEYNLIHQWLCHYISTDSDLVETKDINISVVKRRSYYTRKIKRENKTIEGTRPIIAQIDKPTITLKPIEFEEMMINIIKEAELGLGFTPFVWYNSYQISVCDIKSLRLYYDGVHPKLVLNFIDSVGLMKKKGRLFRWH